MESYNIYILRVEDGKQMLEAKIELHHLVPAIAIPSHPHACILLDMALTAVQSTEGPKLKCDLVNMCLVEPPSKTERLVPRE